MLQRTFIRSGDVNSAPPIDGESKRDKAMEDVQQRCTAIKQLLAAKPVPFGEAEPPAKPGIYLMTYEGEPCYIGMAKGRFGLRDRLMRAHLHGEDGHVLHRELGAAFPDKAQRVARIKEAVSIQWIEAAASDVANLERALINLIDPAWNRH